jgi:hypothetical protein
MRVALAVLAGLCLAGCGSLASPGLPRVSDGNQVGAAGLFGAFKESSYKAVSLSAFDQYDKRLMRAGQKYRLVGNLTHRVLVDASGRSAGRLEWHLFDGTRSKSTGVARSAHLSERQMTKQLKLWPSRAEQAPLVFDEKLNVVVYVSVVAQDYPLRIDAVRDGQGRLIKD